MVVPFDFVHIHSGSAQRVKADLLALGQSGFDVEILCPSATQEHNLYASERVNSLPKATLRSYPNIQKYTFLPEKARLLFDSYSQIVNPFFHSTLRRHSNNYSVVFAHFPMSFVAAHLAIGQTVPIIYVAHDFEYGLLRQSTWNPLIRKFVHHIEKYACHKASKILCVSEQDMRDLERAYKIPPAKLGMLPNTVDVDFYSQTHILYDKVAERQKLGLGPGSLLLLFHGRMDYSANLDALKFVLNELVQALRRLGDNIRLIVAGAQIPKWCYDKGSEIVSLYSDVPDMRRFFSIVDAVIVPLTIGGGTRLKILESFASKVPVISTAKGAEGIDCQDGQHILIAQRNADDFINKTKVLAENEGLRRKLITNAYDLAVQKYSTTVASGLLHEVITEIENQTRQTRDARA
jgi:glycosyltransferase involved in cell wall biosynthesis